MSSLSKECPHFHGVKLKWLKICSYKDSCTRAHTHTHAHTHTVMYLLVCLHLASHYPEGIVGGVVIDLDSAEGLGSSACRQPLLTAIVIDHHSGPSLANTRLTGRQRVRQQKETAWAVLSFESMKITRKLLKTKFPLQHKLVNWGTSQTSITFNTKNHSYFLCLCSFNYKTHTRKFLLKACTSV